MELFVEKTGINFEGVSHIDGKVVFVNGACAGDVVDAEIADEKKSYSIAKIKSVISRGNEYREPVCKYFGECGGCDCQHVKYPFQLTSKCENVKNTIKKIAGIDLDCVEIEKSGSILNYRDKSVFCVKNGKIGFKKRASDDLVEVNSCMIANDFINLILSQIKQNVDLSANYVHHIVIRSLCGKALVTFVCFNKKYQPNLEKFEANLDPKRVGIFFNFNEKSNAEILSDNFVHVFGIEKIKSRLLGIMFEIGAGSFFQTNLGVCEKLYDYVSLNVLYKNVIEGYSGTSLLSAIIAKKVDKISAIEINKEAIKTAKKLLKANGITNVACFNAKVEEKIGALLAVDKNESKKTTLVLDPPKIGCDKNVIETIVKSVPEQIIYISCCAQTLSRDISLLKSLYNLKSVRLFDMFPQTKQVECVAILEKA